MIGHYLCSVILISNSEKEEIAKALLLLKPEVSVILPSAQIGTAYGKPCLPTLIKTLP